MRASDAKRRYGAALERLVLTAGLTAYFILGYFGVGLASDPARAIELWTPLDARIPFVSGSVWIYLWVFPAALTPTFLVRCPRLYRRTCAAYAVVISVSLLVFVLLPVTSRGLRVDPATLDVGRFSEWAVATLYSIDPPYNLFPSLHLSIAVLAAASALKADRRYGVVTAVGVLLVLVSISTVKQHFLLDGLAGVALGVVVAAAVIRPYRPAPGETPAASWRGVAAYLGLLGALLAGCYVTFRWAS